MFGNRCTCLYICTYERVPTYTYMDMKDVNVTWIENQTSQIFFLLRNTETRDKAGLFLVRNRQG